MLKTKTHYCGTDGVPAERQSVYWYRRRSIDCRVHLVEPILVPVYSQLEREHARETAIDFPTLIPVHHFNQK